MNIANLLYRLTASRPCRLIHRGQGERYLERYWIVRWRGCTAYLHRFVAADADEWVHDHPWSWSVAIVLTGGYREERLKWFDPATGWKAVIRLLGGWRRINIIKGGDFHRILDCVPETWTLFIHGPRVKGWGFLEHHPAGEAWNYMNHAINPSWDVTAYHQPYNVTKTEEWQRTAPAGRDADRARLMDAS